MTVAGGGSFKETVPQSNSERPVDTAMRLERPEKQAVRNLWLEELRQFDTGPGEDDVPLYLTLPGAAGLDIKLLVDNDMIELTENGAISPRSMKRVVAIESDKLAAKTLQSKYPGLKIVEQNFASLVAGESLLSYPKGGSQEKKWCCARVVNLDLTSSLNAQLANGVAIFPVLIWIQKIAQLHASVKPEEDWCLCLTLNGNITWTPEVSAGIVEYLLQNFDRSEAFAASCRSHFGEVLYRAITEGLPLGASTLSAEEQQKLLMVFVPKKIGQLVYNQNWKVRTAWNLRYGGEPGVAPMVTWILKFAWDVRAALTPDVVYNDCLSMILTSSGHVSEVDGIQARNPAQ